jgi:PQQ-dependent dehydrogenase (methanol/ethanol family)
MAFIRGDGGMRHVLLVGVVGALLVLLFSTTGATGATSVDGNWLSFGRTTDNMRHSPLTLITPSNVSQLGRAYTIDWQKIDPDIKRGEQSYPLALNGTLFVTTNDANVFAVDGATGAIKWHFKPANSGLFKNFGIVANRGLAYCDGALFLLTLDMHINKLNPSTGALEGRVAIGAAVPGAGSNYGYSETSAPICADHRVILGAAGSEYGVRGFIMAWTTGLRPAWANPVWTIPPDQQSWRSLSRVVGGGAVWTPVTVDTSTNTVFFGTGSATPLYFPSLRPGTNPRTDSLIAVDLKTGVVKWWRQLLAGNEWSYDVAQPPLVYNGKVGGHAHRVVSVATMEGVWFAFDAKTGAPFYSRVKVIDRVEHPALRPGQPVVVYPSSIGGLNFSPASYDPSTNYVINAAAETAAVDIQAKLTPAQKKDKFVLGSVFLGLSNGNFGTELPGWHDHGSISAIDVNTGKRVWKFGTPEPERGGVTTTASGLGFAGGGDGVLRAFNVKTGKILWTFQTGHQIAAGPTIFSANGKEYLAISVGGTPTSSNGGTAAWLEVFALGGSQAASPPPQLDRALASTSQSSPSLVVETARPSRTAQLHATVGGAHISTQGPFAVHVWQANGANTQVVGGQLTLGGRPVAHATMQVDSFTLRNRTNGRGQFFYRLDTTLVHRHVVRVQGLSAATVGGHALSKAQRAALLRVGGGFSVGYAVSDLHASSSGGHVVVTGRLGYASGQAPPPVVLYTYRLSGTITDASGKPVVGASVVTRTQDRDFWTFSVPSDTAGHYVSFFTASDESGANPVPLTVQVASGRVSYASAFGQNVNFTALHSATMNIKLPASPTTPLPLPTNQSYPGAVYAGVLVGVSGPGGVIQPVSATWPDRAGRFKLVLPSSASGKTLSVWEVGSTFFQVAAARPGGPIEIAGTWPSVPPGHEPQGLAVVHAP